MRFIVGLMVCVFLYTTGCAPQDQDSPVTQEEHSDLLGMWVMGNVFQDTLDVTDEHNPALNRWITFREDGTFESGGAPYGYNAGKWSYDSSSKELYLDSDAGEGDDSYWIIDDADTTMQWQGARSDFTSQFKLNFKKKGF